MQDASDLDPLRDQHIEDQVSTFMVLAVAGTDRIAGTTQGRRVSKHREALIELGQVLVALGDAPGLLRLARDRFQVLARLAR
jgi:hypothetical protein